MNLLLLFSFFSRLLYNILQTSPLEPLRFLPNDTESDKRRKQKEHTEKLQQREDIKRKREPELMRKFNMCIDRVFRSRKEKLILDISKNTFSYSNDVIPSAMQCAICHNLDASFFITDYKSGDTICKGPRGEVCLSFLRFFFFFFYFLPSLLSFFLALFLILTCMLIF